MAAVRQVDVDTFSAILAEVEQFQSSCTASWYRGVGSDNYSLLPSIARKRPTPSAEELHRIEKSIGTAFAQKSPPFVRQTFSNEWKSMFYMQHYGVPTRLLDWSESPFVSLYFALSSVTRDKIGRPSSDPALWLCDPIGWNRTALRHISFAGGILDETCEEVKAYSPASDVDQRAITPIMVFGTHNSPRIVAQRGVFAVFGKGTKGMEEIFDEEKYDSSVLLKLKIDKKSVDSILGSLYRKGVAESTIYPDLHGLALELKRNYGYH